MLFLFECGWGYNSPYDKVVEVMKNFFCMFIKCRRGSYFYFLGGGGFCEKKFANESGGYRAWQLDINFQSIKIFFLFKFSI